MTPYSPTTTRDGTDCADCERHRRNHTNAVDLNDGSEAGMDSEENTWRVYDAHRATHREIRP